MDQVRKTIVNESLVDFIDHNSPFACGTVFSSRINAKTSGERCFCQFFQLIFQMIDVMSSFGYFSESML
jgi:hypothetical protein